MQRGPLHIVKAYIVGNRNLPQEQLQSCGKDVRVNNCQLYYRNQGGSQHTVGWRGGNTDLLRRLWGELELMRGVSLLFRQLGI